MMPTDLPDRKETIRRQIIALLTEQEADARDISQLIGIQEKAVYEHLTHIARSLAAQKKKLIVTPFRCLLCGFEFKDRKRLSRPGRCPKCKQGHLQAATYHIGPP